MGILRFFWRGTKSVRRDPDSAEVYGVSVVTVVSGFADAANVENGLHCLRSDHFGGSCLGTEVVQDWWAFVLSC